MCTCKNIHMYIWMQLAVTGAGNTYSTCFRAMQVALVTNIYDNYITLSNIKCILGNTTGYTHSMRSYSLVSHIRTKDDWHISKHTPYSLTHSLTHQVVHSNTHQFYPYIPTSLPPPSHLTTISDIIYQLAL